MRGQHVGRRLYDAPDGRVAAGRQHVNKVRHDAAVERRHLLLRGGGRVLLQQHRRTTLAVVVSIRTTRIAAVAIATVAVGFVTVRRLFVTPYVKYN